MRRYGVVVVWFATIAIFSVLRPDTFFTFTTVQTLAGSQAVLLILALGLLIPVIHMKGTRDVLGGDIGTSGQAFLFVWTLLALGITATFSIILSARALLSLPWRRSRRASTAA